MHLLASSSKGIVCVNPLNLRQGYSLRTISSKNFFTSIIKKCSAATVTLKIKKQQYVSIKKWGSYCACWWEGTISILNKYSKWYIVWCTLRRWACILRIISIFCVRSITAIVSKTNSLLVQVQKNYLGLPEPHGYTSKNYTTQVFSRPKTLKSANRASLFQLPGCSQFSVQSSE